MRKLPHPIKRALRDETPDDETVERLWEATRGKLRPARPAWQRVALPATMVAVAATVLVLLFVRPWRAPELLVRADGQPLSTMIATTPQVVALSDGTTIELETGARLEPMAERPGFASFRLDAGRARFAVPTSTSRRWSLDGGIAVIDFGGAAFAAWRQDGELEVRVFTGEVTLRGKAVPNGEKRLVAGESLSLGNSHAPPPPPVIAPVPPPAEPPSEPAPRRVLDKDTAAHRPLPRLAANQARADWRALADQARFAEAYAQLGATGVSEASARSASMDELLMLADVARRAGHPQEAIPVLERAERELSDDRRAGLAAYTRARILAEDLKQPRASVLAFERALALGLPATLTESALVRLAELELEAGNGARAAQRASEYLAKFPEGKQRAKMQRIRGDAP